MQLWFALARRHNTAQTLTLFSHPLIWSGRLHRVEPSARGFSLDTLQVDGAI